MNIEKQLKKLERLDTKYKKLKKKSDDAKDILSKQEQKMLSFLLSEKLQNLSDDILTVYQKTDTIPVMQDKIAFVKYAVENEAWDLLPASVNSVAWRRMIEKEPVPGVKRERKTKFGMRRK